MSTIVCKLLHEHTGNEKSASYFICYPSLERRSIVEFISEFLGGTLNMKERVLIPHNLFTLAGKTHSSTVIQIRWKLHMLHEKHSQSPIRLD